MKKIITALFVLLLAFSAPAQAAFPITFGTLTGGNQPLSDFDVMFGVVGEMGTVQNTATGTNTLALTPIANMPTISAYVNYQRFGFVAPATSTSGVTVNINTVGALPVFLSDGVTQASTGNIVIGVYYEIVYNLALNGGTGGFQIVSSTNNFNNAALTGVPTAPTAAIGTATTQIATTQFVLQNNTGGYINKFRNPVMKYSQRGTGAAITTPGTFQYTIDGWMQTSIGASATWTNGCGGAGGTNPINCLLYFTGAASVTDVQFKQRIESFDSADLYTGANIMVTFQVLQDTGGSVTPTLTVKCPTAVDNYGSTTTIVNAVSLQPVANSTYANLSYVFAGNVCFQNGMEVTLDTNAALNTTGKHFYLVAADIRYTPLAATGLNSLPPVIEIPNMAEEVIRDERYLKCFGQTLGPMGSGAATGTTNVGFIIPFHVPLRALASMTLTTVGDFQVFNYAGAGITALTGLSLITTSKDQATVSGSAAGLTTGTAYYLNNAIALTGNLCFSAEL